MLPQQEDWDDHVAVTGYWFLDEPKTEWQPDAAFSRFLENGPPPVYVGGSAPQALQRAVRFGHGWLPMVRDPEALAGGLGRFRSIADAAGSAPGPVTVLTGLPLNEPARAQDLLGAYRELGVERLVCGLRYDDADAYRERLTALRSISGGPG